MGWGLGRLAPAAGTCQQPAGPRALSLAPAGMRPL